MSNLSASEKALNIILDYAANKVFHKPFIELQLGEQMTVYKFMKDDANPEWKPVYLITGQLSQFEVSNTGMVRNIHTHEECKQHQTKGGYLYTSIGSKSMFVHRLVAQTFIPNPEKKKEVNHINGNKTLNWVGNLEWATRQENATHAAKTGLILVGSKQPVATHTEEDAHLVCKLLEQGKGVAKVVKETGFSKTFVIGIAYRNEWSHVSRQYNIPKAKDFLDEETVHLICKKLQDGESVRNIAKELGVKDGRIYGIQSGVSWRRVSNQYNIPGLEKAGPVDPKISDLIYKAFESGISSWEDVTARLNLEPTKSMKKYIRRLKIRYDMEHSSAS